jgi:CRISPR system Cascade subunit CasE
MYFSQIRLRRNVSPREAAALCRGGGYQTHKLIWNLFSDGPDRRRGFLYRSEEVKRLPAFYTVSDREPVDTTSAWDIQTKRYAPKISRGDRLSFTLRVNPIRSKRDENGRQHRHDVVMEAKKQVQFREMPQHERPHVATLVQDAGLAWIKAREEKYGFFVGGNKEEPGVRADGYRQHKLFKGKGARPVTFSTLDYNGILTVTDPDTFVKKTLFSGIGPAKAFGCGLMLVRRI